MKPEDFKSMDDFIEAVLGGESFRNVPQHFNRELSDKLYVAQAIHLERRHFGLIVLSGSLVFTILFGSTTLYMLFGGIFAAVQAATPGFWGYVDAAVLFLGDRLIEWNVSVGVMMGFVMLMATRESWPSRKVSAH